MRAWVLLSVAVVASGCDAVRAAAVRNTTLAARSAQYVHERSCRDLLRRLPDDAPAHVTLHTVSPGRCQVAATTAAGQRAWEFEWRLVQRLAPTVAAQWLRELQGARGAPDVT